VRVIFLYICIVIGLAFKDIPMGYTKTIPFFRVMYPSDRPATNNYPERHRYEVSYTYRIELKDWLNYLGNQIVIICLSLLLFYESSKYRFVFKAFLVLQIANIFDYMITFNTGWFVVSDFIVTFNTVMCFLLTLVIVYEYGRPDIN
jgi:hypothetical protein